MDDKERYAFALRGLQQVHGNRVEAFYTGRGQTQSWVRNRYAMGEAAVFAPRQLTQLHRAIPTIEGPLHFAGEHTSLKHSWIEAALESSVRAALASYRSRTFWQPNKQPVNKEISPKLLSKKIEASAPRTQKTQRLERKQPKLFERCTT
jgi:hypothetical protein